MPETNELSLREKLALLALMAEAREMTNSELRDTAGITIDGAVRRNLNDRRLVESRRAGRAFVHDLTDQGWERCEELLAERRPAGSNYVAGVLFAVLAGVGRYLGRSESSLSAIYQPDVGAAIRSAYGRLAAKPGEWVPLTGLRSELTWAHRSQVDDVLVELADAVDVHFASEANQKVLTDEDREAALRLGGQDKHLLAIEPA